MCKSKGGLTRHTKSKHSGQAAETHAELCQATVASFVESIKVKIREDNLYGSDIDGGLDSVSSTVSLYDALLPLYETVRLITARDCPRLPGKYKMTARE